MAMLFAIFTAANLFSALNVELSVKECAGVGSSGFPVMVVVPLPEGAYQDTSHFRVTDAGGATVPAQFTVMNRRWYNDRSIANILVRFQPVVGAFSGAGTGLAKYYLKDDGSGNATGTGLTVSDNGSIITVNTGVLRFTVKKTGFNIFDQVWLGGQLVLQADSTSGGELLHWKNIMQRDLSRNDVLVEIEESGPMEAVIRLEAVTKYSSPSNHTHGWCVRIYAYAGKSFVKVDYQLQNSSKDKRYTYPLYFEAMNLNFNLNLTGTPNVRVGLDNETFYKGARGAGVLLAQKKDSLFGIYGGLDTTATLLASGGRPAGILDIDDGTVGISAITRFYYQNWPNGIQVNGNNRLQIQLWPEWSNQVISAAKNPVFNTTGMYWLQDMQHVYKEVYLDFHASGKSDAEVLNFAKTVNYHPVAGCKTEWYSAAKASVDLEGIIPLTHRVATTDKRLPGLQTSANLGWNYFSIIDGRRTNCSNVGGGPLGTQEFFAKEDPADWYTAEMYAWGEMNVRPTWMAQYNFERDFPALRLGVNVCTGGETSTGVPTEDYGRHPNWRQQDCGNTTYDSTLLSGTIQASTLLLGECDVRQPPHGWFYNVADAYFMSGNLWMKDWYKFINEFRKTFLMHGNTAGAIRGNGHWCAQALTASSVTGDTTIIGMMTKAFVNKLMPEYRKNTGDVNEACCGAPPKDPIFEEGFEKRQVVNLMNLIKDKDPQGYAELFRWLAGLVHFNMRYAHWTTGWAPRVDASTGSGGYTFADAQAWYYSHTGIKPVMDFVMDPLYSGGWQMHGYANTTAGWDGQLFCRYAQFVRDAERPDSIPPAAITDLSLARNGTSCRLQWTAPVYAKRYFVAWDNKPIVDNFSMDDFDYRYTQWYSAKTVGTAMVARPGQTETLTFTAPDTGLVIAAIFSFDSADNMSGISNLGKSDQTPPSAPVLQATSADAHNMQLTWAASNDPESDIYLYNVYKNGVKAATFMSGLEYDKKGLKTTAALSTFRYAETDLTENIAYTYEVAAVNGSLVEGTRNQVILTMPADNAPPVIVSAGAFSTTLPPQIIVTFSEKVEQASAETAANYVLSNGAVVLSAGRMEDNRTVILTVDTMTEGTAYQLTVNNVKDAAAPANTIAANTNKTFIFTPPFIYRAKFPDASLVAGNTLFYKWNFLLPGISVLSDDDYRPTPIPEEYMGLPLLQTMNANEKYDYLPGTTTAYILNVNKETFVYVAYDDSQRVHDLMPAWLKDGWTDTDKDIGRFSVYVKKYPAGDVVLGGNNGSIKYYMYFVLLEPTDGSLLHGSLNLALRKTVTAYSQIDFRLKGAKYLTDGEKGVGSGTEGWYAWDFGVKQGSMTWVEVDLGGDMPFSQIVLYPATDTMTADGKSSKFPVDFTITAKTEAGAETTIVSMVNYPVPDFGVGQVFNFPPVVARHIRVTPTKLGLAMDPRQTWTTYNCVLEELEVYNKSALGNPPVGEESDSFPEFVEGMAVYPNPFNPSVRMIVHALQTSNYRLDLNRVKLDIFNVQGRLVARLVPLRVSIAGNRGIFEYNWNAANFPSGMFFAKMSIDKKGFQKKLILVK
jgi:hypothetical protein